jgi:putative transposase
MRAHGLSAPFHARRRRGSKAHDRRITTDTPDVMWGTDATGTLTGEGYATIFLAADHCTGELVGVHAAKKSNRFEALEPVRQGVRTCFGGFHQDIAAGLSLRHDHGSQ